MPAAGSVSPPPYLSEVVAHLREREPKLWEHVAAALARPEDDPGLRLALLKSSVRLDRTTHGRLYGLADGVTAALGFTQPVTFYQAIGAQPSINAAVMSHATEAHVVLHGPAVSSLADPELTALIAHELAHLELWRRDGGSYRIAESLLRLIAEGPGASPAHARTYNLFRQYCEVFADRTALEIAGSVEAVIACLIKVETGLAEVSPAAYLQQAEEVLRAGAASEGITHPETFIRARALARWAQSREASEDELRHGLHGPLTIDTMDLLQQLEWEQLTRSLIDSALAEPWMRTDATLAHARLFFSGYQPAPARPDALAPRLAQADASLRDYACFLLLDFAAADPQLEDAPLAQAFFVAEELGLSSRLAELAAKELGLTKKRIQAVRSDLQTLRRQAATG